MGTKKRTLVLTIVALMAAIAGMATIAGAQTQQESVALTDYPVPAWPASGVVPAEMKDKYVFVDLAKNEFVLAYPENLGAPTFEKDGPGPLKIVRYDLLRNVEPSAAVAVTTASPGRFKYVYTVGNGAAAKQSLDQFSLSAPEAVGAAIKGPAGWFAIVQKGRSFKLINPDWLKTGAALVWSFQKPEEVIQPGSKKTGFEIESDLRPGFTVGYFRKAESVEVRVATSGNIPQVVKDQRDQLLAVEYNSKTLLVIGPKFAKDVDDKTVAADFVKGIEALGKSGALNPGSDFVKATLTELNRVAGAGSPARFTAQPRTETETEVFNALKASIRVN